MRKNIYAPICVYHFAIHQKLTQHCKSTKLQQQKKPKQRYSPALSSVRLLSHVRLCDPMDCSTPASLSITNSWSLLKFMSIESVMPSNHLILCCPFSSHLQSFPASGSFQMSQFFTSGGQRIGVSASTSVLPMNIQD